MCDFLIQSMFCLGGVISMLLSVLSRFAEVAYYVSEETKVI